MTDVSITRTGEFMRKLVEILLDHPDGMRSRDVMALLIKSFTLTDYELGQYPSTGANRFETIVRFGSIDLVKAGWLIKENGKWSVTEEGRAAYKKYLSPHEFYATAQKLYKVWRNSQTTSDSGVDAEPQVEQKAATISLEESEEKAREELEKYLLSIHPYEFQKLVAALIKAMGYHISWIAPPGKDGGVDILAWNDPLGTKPPRIKVQVKREQTSVTVTTLRSFMAILGTDEVGIFVSTGGFTKDTTDAARNQQNRQVTLIDMDRFLELWIQYMDRVDEEARDMFPLKPVYFLNPEK